MLKVRISEREYSSSPETTYVELSTKEFLEKSFKKKPIEDRLAMLEDIVFAIVAHYEDKELLEDILWVLDYDANIVEE